MIDRHTILYKIDFWTSGFKLTLIGYDFFCATPQLDWALIFNDVFMKTFLNNYVGMEMASNYNPTYRDWEQFITVSQQL